MSYISNKEHQLESSVDELVRTYLSENVTADKAAEIQINLRDRAAAMFKADLKGGTTPVEVIDAIYSNVLAAISADVMELSHSEFL